MPFFDHFPYTNLHNVNLDWVLQKVKEWGAMVEQNNQNFIDLQAANESFKEYVTSYLTNLDVQEEINNKLDDMLQSGVLIPYLQPYIVTTVTDWLDENITPTTPAIDATLSIAGAAADAKATGDAIANLRAYIDAEGGLSNEAARLLVTVLSKMVTIDSNIYPTFVELADELNVSIPAGLPTGYTEYDYIAPANMSFGTLPTLIFLPLTGNKQLYRYTFRYKDIGNVNRSIAVFGGRDAQGYSDSLAFYSNVNINTVGYHLMGLEETQVNNAFQPNIINTVTITGYDTPTVSINNVTYTVASNTTDTESPISLFSNQIAGATSGGYGSGRVQLGRLRVNDAQGNLLGDYVPCVENSTTNVGVYDKVSNQFIGAANTAYIAGNWS